MLSSYGTWPVCLNQELRPRIFTSQLRMMVSGAPEMRVPLSLHGIWGISGTPSPSQLILPESSGEGILVQYSVMQAWILEGRGTSPTFRLAAVHNFSSAVLLPPSDQINTS